MGLVYLWNSHFCSFKEPCFFDIYKNFFHFPNYHSILFGELYSLNRCDPSKKGKVPASRPGVSRPKYELLHLNHVLAPPQTPTHGVHWSLNDTPWYKLCISVPSVLWGAIIAPSTWCAWIRTHRRFPKGLETHSCFLGTWKGLVQSPEHT